MIENLYEQLHQGNTNNEKVQKLVPVLDGNLSVKNAAKLSVKYLDDKISNKYKQSSNFEDIFKSAKNCLEKLSAKEDSFKTTISQVLNKIPNRNKTSKQQHNFCKDKISLEVDRMQREAKFLRERKFQGNNTNFVKIRFLLKFMAYSEVLTL